MLSWVVDIAPACAYWMPRASRPPIKWAFLPLQQVPAVGGVEGERGCFPKAPVLVATAAGAASTKEAGGADRGADLAGAGGPLGPEAEASVALCKTRAAWHTLIKEGGGCRHFFKRQQVPNVNICHTRMREVWARSCTGL